MDDDLKQYKLQFKGTSYTFREIPQDDLATVSLLNDLNVGQRKIIKGLTSVLCRSAGEEQWDAITDRLIAKEISLEEMTVGLFKLVMKKQAKDQPAPAADDGE